MLGRAQKRYNVHCLQFYLGESCPPALALMPSTSVPPRRPLVPFKLLPWCWSPEWVTLNKSTCGARLFQRSLRSQFLPDPTDSGFGGTAFFQKFWGLIFLALELWAGWSGMRVGSLAPKISLHFISTAHGFEITWSQSPSFQPIWMNVVSLIPELSYFHTTQFSDGSEWCLFYILDVILLWFCEEVSHIYLCLYISTRNPGIGRCF